LRCQDFIIGLCCLVLKIYADRLLAQGDVGGYGQEEEGE